jgi:predicted amidophosphoribosyltransferase
MSTVVCWNCGRDLADIPRPISRHNNCPECFSNLHCCRLCKYFLPERVGVCAEDRADPPVEKENANFCDFFRPANAAFQQSTETKRKDASAALARLFENTKAETTAAPGSASPDEAARDGSTVESPIDLLNELFVTRPKKP